MRKAWFLVLAIACVGGLSYYAFSSGSGPKTPLSAVTAQASAPSPSPASMPAVPVSGPRIQFASRTCDFGKVNGDTQVTGSFVFTNVGTEMLEVTDVTPSCSCMKVGDWTRKVPPGQTGSIALRYDSRYFTGPFGKWITVTCNDTNQAKLNLDVKGYVWRPLEITPPTAVLNLNAETPSNATTIRLISHLDEPLTLSDLQCTQPAVAVELATNQPGKEYQLTVKTIPPWPSNNLQGQISIKTSTTNLPVININTWINVQPIVIAIPLQVKLPPGPFTNTVPFNLWVRNNGTNAISLSEPTIAGKGVDVEIKEDLAGRQFSLLLRFPPGFEVLANEKVELSVNTSHPLFPVLKVPIIQQPRPVGPK